MSILSSFFLKIAERHRKEVAEKYKHRNLRPLNFFRGAVLQGMSFDESDEIFTQDFFDQLKTEMKDTDRFILKCISCFFGISFLIFSAHVGSDVSVVWIGVKLGDLLFFSDFLAIIAGVSLYLGAVGMAKSGSLYNLIEEYVDAKIGEKKLVMFAETRALWLSKFGRDFFDYPSRQIIVKGKFIYAPYKLRNFVDKFWGFSFDIFFVLLLVFWITITFYAITHPPISLYVSIVAYLAFWAFAIMSGVVIFMYFCVLTGILAKGVREKPTTDQNIGQIVFEDF